MKVHKSYDGTFYLRQDNGVRMWGSYATQAAAVMASKLDFDVIMGIADQFDIITEDMLAGREGSQDITPEQSKAFWDEIAHKYRK